MSTKTQVDATVQAKDIKSNQIEIDGKKYDFLYNRAKLANMYKNTGVNLMAEIALAPNGFIDLFVLETLFVYGILAGDADVDELFTKSISKYKYMGLIDIVFSALKKDMGFLFPEA